MNSSKYYTPEIEEFSINFEFETRTICKKTKEERWKHNRIELNEYVHKVTDLDENMTVVFINPMEFIYLNLRDGNIRVKYLDRQDIEELGWTNYEPPHEYNHKWILGNYELNVWFNNEIPVVRITNYPLFFQGKIKNKSELKKLMQQLGI